MSVIHLSPFLIFISLIVTRTSANLFPPLASYLYVSTEDKLAGETEALIHKHNPKYTLKPLTGFCHDLVRRGERGGSRGEEVKGRGARRAMMQRRGKQRLTTCQHEKLVLQGKFKFVEQHCFDYAQPFTQEGWLKRIQAHSGVGAAMTGDQVSPFSVRCSHEPAFVL